MRIAKLLRLFSPISSVSLILCDSKYMGFSTFPFIFFFGSFKTDCVSYALIARSAASI